MEKYEAFRNISLLYAVLCGMSFTVVVIGYVENKKWIMRIGSWTMGLWSFLMFIIVLSQFRF